MYINMYPLWTLQVQVLYLLPFTGRGNEGPKMRLIFQGCLLGTKQTL